MATKSVLKSIHIKDRKSALRLVSAMERAEEKKQQAKKVEISRVCKDASREEIRKLFGLE